MAGGGGGGGGAGYDISASSSATSAAKQTVAKRVNVEQGRITFGARKDNTLLYVALGLAAVFILFKGVK